MVSIAAARSASDAGVGQHQVEASEFIDDLCNKRLEGFQVCHIQLAVVHPLRGGRVLMVARGGYNGGAALDQCLNQGGSDCRRWRR